MLRFWVQAVRRVQELGERLLGDRFMILDYDALCRAPRVEIEKLLDFVDVEVGAEVLDRLGALPHIPKSCGRYKNGSLDDFDPDDVEVVRAFGFAVD